MASIDWQFNKGQLQCAKHMLKHSINCDVNFKVGANREIIKAHKLILSMRSPVFETMFNGMFIESSQDPVIPDIDPDAFRALLRYCYYDCLDIYECEALNTLQAATKYMLPKLADTAKVKLIRDLTVDNIWPVYTYGLQVDDEQILKACHEYFQMNVAAVRCALDSEDFLDVTHDVLVDFLSINLHCGEQLSDISASSSDSDSESDVDSNDDSAKESDDDYKDDSEKDEDREPPTKELTEIDGMGVCIAEIELFKACNAWAEAECVRRKLNPCGENKRVVLKGVLFRLGLPTIKHKDLVNIVYPTNILQQSEKDGLSAYKLNETVSEYSLDFPLTERKFLLLAEPRLIYRDHFAKQMGRHYSGGDKNVVSSLNIESTVPAELSKIWLPGSDYRIVGNANVTITNDDSGERWSKPVSLHRQHQLKYQYRGQPPLIYLPIKKFILTPHVSYSIDVSHSCNMKEGPRCINLQKTKMSPGKPRKLDEIKVSGTKKGNLCVYALTLCLV